MAENFIHYLSKPNIKGDKLPYVNTNKEIYVNLFKIIIKKPLKLYQYPYSVSPEIETGDFRIRNKLFKYCGMKEKDKRIKPKDIYGECFISGDSLYGMKEVKESKTFKCKLYLDGETEYTITFQPKVEERTINQNDLEKDSLTKQFIEILIRDILHGNPNLEFYKGLCDITGENLKEDEVKDIFFNLDTNKNGCFEQEEFIKAAVDKKIFLSEKMIKFAFNFFDQDKSGLITIDEMIEIFKDNADDNIDIKKEFQNLIGTLDSDSDGKIDFNEFTIFMKTFLEQ